MELITKTCAHQDCNNTFTTIYPKKRFCCKCHQQSHIRGHRLQTEEVTCIICGKTVKRRGPAQITCNAKECKKKRQSMIGKDKTIPRKKYIGRFSTEYNEVKEVALARQDNKLPPLRPGIRPCMRCGHTFKSWDVSKNRMCPDCCDYAEELVQVEPDCGRRVGARS